MFGSKNHFLIFSLYSHLFISYSNCSYLSNLLLFFPFYILLAINVLPILRSDKRHKSRLSHVNVFYAIMEDN